MRSIHLGALLGLMAAIPIQAHAEIVRPDERYAPPPPPSWMTSGQYDPLIRSSFRSSQRQRRKLRRRSVR